MKDPGEQHMLENNCKRIFHVDQYFFLPKHATHSFTPLWSHSKFLWRERNPKSSKNVLCPCWLLFKVCPVTYFWEYFIIIYSLYFSVCFFKKELDLWCSKSTLGTSAGFASRFCCRPIVDHWATGRVPSVSLASLPSANWRTCTRIWKFL